ncbi:uncharacterized protein LOC114526653 [Dendronephthya gigantea]|uniref:uncharacterized protein LOC114526653 n=1 Tax=Dendronephthya gigantea TaxID=151771 RepID=UPI00106A342F|nr:uncharacterized protein LOC114526653 [Dendronephthya gigantea]
MTTSLLQPSDPSLQTQQNKLRKKQSTQAMYYNRSAKDLSKLKIGDVVRMKPTRLGENKWRKAVVTSKHDDRSYYVKTKAGGTYRRNRVHLRRSNEPFSSSEDDEPLDDLALDDDGTQEETAPIGRTQEETAPIGPTTVPAPQTLAGNRPQRQRRPPSYLKDYDCN